MWVHLHNVYRSCSYMKVIGSKSRSLEQLITEYTHLQVHAPTLTDRQYCYFSLHFIANLNNTGWNFSFFTNTSECGVLLHADVSVCLSVVFMLVTSFVFGGPSATPLRVARPFLREIYGHSAWTSDASLRLQQCDFRFDLFFSFSFSFSFAVFFRFSFSFASYFLVLVLFQFY